MTLRLAAKALVAALALLTIEATAADAASGKGLRSQRAKVVTPPPKDCRRYNGYSGYYGNPWCTDAEIERWERWDARRTGK